MLGVEMASTGEVGCFGRNRYDAYLKALLSTGFVLPRPGGRIFLSIGGYHVSSSLITNRSNGCDLQAKDEMLNSVRTLVAMKYAMYASKGTADYFQSKNIPIMVVDWPFDEGVYALDGKTSRLVKNVGDFLANKEFDVVINLPIRGSGAYRVSAFRTHGYRTRRMAIDNGIPLITDIKCAKLFVEVGWVFLPHGINADLQALRMLGGRPMINTQIDCISSSEILRLPGLIDIHVHMR
jgi:carbamoyl-phosphate synthase/aspartate carbamoyltransferase/dihydroorotase